MKSLNTGRRRPEASGMDRSETPTSAKMVIMMTLFTASRTLSCMNSSEKAMAVYPTFVPLNIIGEAKTSSPPPSFISQGGGPAAPSIRSLSS